MLVKLSGLTSRTFRYYEQIGLIRSLYRPNRYSKRRYLGGIVLEIQQILLYKRMGMKLKQILQKMSMVRSEHIRIIKEQKASLLLESSSLKKIRYTVDKTSLALRGKYRPILKDKMLMNVFKYYRQGNPNFEMTLPGYFSTIARRHYLLNLNGHG